MQALGNLLRTARWRRPRAVLTMKTNYFWGTKGPSWARGKNRAQNICLQAYTRVHTHTHLYTGPAFRTCLQRRMNLNFISCYKRIQIRTALFSHFCPRAPSRISHVTHPNQNHARRGMQPSQTGTWRQSHLPTLWLGDSTLAIDPREMSACIYQKPCTNIVLALLLIITKNRKQLERHR